MLKIYKPKNLTDFKFIASLWSEPNNNKFMFTHKVAVKDVKARLKIKNNFTYIVEVDGKRIGNLNLKKSPDGKTGRLGIIIDYKSQGQGYGKEAMELLEEEARKLSINKLKLEVFVANKRAINLYRKLGYKNVAQLMAMEKKIS
ncbi:GNAT family N-acetyltransferase [Candidatus Falkowbacteria bacterium]|nr:GNAT family N-acetyltransferase [Candidatus Falkowbacteria bacterium]